MTEKSDAERIEQIRDLLRILLGPRPVGASPIRIDSPPWTEEQRVAYDELCREADFPGPQD